MIITLLIISCASAELFSPTATPVPSATFTAKPTKTATPTQTFTPTATIDAAGTATQVRSELESAAIDLCERNIPVPGSAAYDPASPPHPIFACNSVYRCWNYNHLPDPVFGSEAWIPKDVSELQLVLCKLEEVRYGGPIKVCQYTGNLNVPIYQERYTFGLFEAKTGNLLKDFIVLSESTFACPLSVASNTAYFETKLNMLELHSQVFSFFHFPTPTASPY